MEEKENEDKKPGDEPRRSGRTIYNQKTGLSIRVNLYIIKYMYYHMKKEKQFYEKMETGKKLKSKEIYQNIIPISRQRFDRINKGDNFEISSSEANQIAETLGIDIKYFRKDNPLMIDLINYDIGITDWKYFYKIKYENKYLNTNEVESNPNQIEVKKQEQQKARKQKVEDALKHLMKTKIEEELDKSDPIYQIYYYFKYGHTVKDRAGSLINDLKEVGYEDWHKRSDVELEEFSHLLKNHYEYINSYITMRNLLKK